MTRNILATCGALAIASATLCAQSSSSTPPGSPSSSQAGQPAAQTYSTQPKTVTYTGCLGSWNGSMSTASGSSAASTPPGASSSSGSGMTGSSGQFMLSNPQIFSSGTSTSGSTADSAVSGSTAGSAAPSGYLLKPQGSSVNFSQYVNQRVRVTGVLENGSSSGTTGSSAGATTPGQTAGQSALQTFTVTSIQPMGSACP